MKVQPYITAMIITSLRDTLSCDHAAARSGTYSAMQLVIDSNKDCIASLNAGNANAIRSLLGHPQITG